MRISLINWVCIGVNMVKSGSQRFDMGVSAGCSHSSVDCVCIFSYASQICGEESGIIWSWVGGL